MAFPVIGFGAFGQGIKGVSLHFADIVQQAGGDRGLVDGQRRLIVSQSRRLGVA